MPFPITRLNAALEGRYHIERELGAGGMATFYLAHDFKHDRKVALKVLKPELAAVVGSERFLAEIRTTANLQHPHILPLFDSGEADGFLFYVMPYVEGESLRDRLDREEQLPVDEAVRIAAAVAGALDYAHRHGVIHRDIKPANIMLHDGQPVVADFGIALAVSVAGGGRLTETGLSLGTPYYMSPEQATAERDPDPRSDVYSLGCVLYEMLSGEPPHTGSSAQAILARILTDTPRPVTGLRETVPPHLAVAVHKALARLPADRFSSANDFLRALSGPSGGQLPGGFTGVAGVPIRAGRRARHMAFVGWSVAAVLAAFSLLQDRPARGPAPPSLDVDLLLPDSAPLVFVGESELGLGRPSVAVSPDGSWLAYIGRVGGSSRVMVRRLDRREEPVALPGTEGAYGPVVSPDGAWIGFFVGRDLKRIAPDGRAPITLAGIPNNAGMAWTPDGTRILVSADEGTNLVWVPASGGDPVPVSQDPLNLWRPDFLPDGRHVLGMSGTDDALTVLDLVTGARRVVTASGVFAPDEVRDSDRITGLSPHYVPSGHIAYMRWDGTLMALPFDSESLEILGQPAPVMSGVRMEAIWGAGQFDFSETGTLVYAPGDNAAVAPMVWVDLQDLKVDTLPFRPRLWGGFDLSSDGRRVLAQVASGESLDALVEIDLVSGTESSIPVSGRPTNPWWWRGEEAAVYFEMDREGTSGPTMRQPLGGGRDPDTLMVDGNASDVSPDGRWLAVSHGERIKGIRLESTEAGQTPLSVFDQPMSWGPAFSPDGRWLAFTSSQSGMYDVYAVALPFSPGDRRIKVSQDGGLEGTWSAQGDLIYRAGRRILRVSPPRPGGTNFGSPEVLFEGPLVDVPFRGHDISPDGNRLLLILGRDADTVDHLRVVTNWFAQLKRLAPPSGG